MCVHAQSCLTLCDPMDYCPLGSSVHRISQVRILKQVVIFFPRRSSGPRDQSETPVSPALADGFFTTAAAAKPFQSCPTLCDPIDGSPPGSPVPGVGCHFLLQCMTVKSESEVTQLCPTLSNPMVCSPPGSSIHGIFQARVLEWGATAFSIFTTESPGKPKHYSQYFKCKQTLLAI